MTSTKPKRSSATSEPRMKTFAFIPSEKVPSSRTSGESCTYLSRIYQIKRNVPTLLGTTSGYVRPLQLTIEWLSSHGHLPPGTKGNAWTLANDKICHLYEL